MDVTSAQLANEMLGKQQDAELFEFTLIGPTLRFEIDAQCVLSGAEMQARLNGSIIERFTIFQVKEGDKLEMGHASEGFRAYLAISAELPVTKAPFISKRLDKGENIVCTSVSELTTPTVTPIHPDQSNKIEILPGPESHFLKPEQFQELENKELKIEASSNRMAYVFQTELKTLPSSFSSSAILPGTVQLTPSGQLNIMMRDAQTTGGYPRIGVLTEKSIDRLAQKRPGETIRLTFLKPNDGI